MSLLGKKPRSDAPAALSVLACGVGAPDGLGCVAGIHCRVPGKHAGSEIKQAIRLFMCEAARHREPKSETATVDGEKVMLHCAGVGEFVYVACVQRSYPRRVVFGEAFGDQEAGSSRAGLLKTLSNESFDLVGLTLAPRQGSASGLVVVELPSRVTQALERVCSSYDDVGSRDSIHGLQEQVDEVHGIMQNNVDQMLDTMDGMERLGVKVEGMAGASKAFRGQARSNRRHMQWEELKWKLLIGGGILAVVLVLFGPWLFSAGS